MKPEHSGCFIGVTSSSSRLQLDGDARELGVAVVEGIVWNEGDCSRGLLGTPRQS